MTAGVGGKRRAHRGPSPRWLGRAEIVRAGSSEAAAAVVQHRKAEHPHGLARAGVAGAGVQVNGFTEHYSVSSLNDPAREASPCSRYLRPARDVAATCTVQRNVHESLAPKVRAHRAPNLLRGCVGRSHADHTEARNDFVGCFGRSDRRALQEGPACSAPRSKTAQLRRLRELVVKGVLERAATHWTRVRP
jgi:hypothetical protein